MSHSGINRRHTDTVGSAGNAFRDPRFRWLQHESNTVTGLSFSTKQNILSQLISQLSPLVYSNLQLKLDKYIFSSLILTFFNSLRSTYLNDTPLYELKL